MKSFFEGDTRETEIGTIKRVYMVTNTIKNPLE